MRFLGHLYLPLAASAAIGLAACSGASAPAKGNSANSPGPAGAPAGNSARPEQSDADTAKALCIASATRRFGISADDVSGYSFGGGSGDTPRSLEGQITIDLFGPPARHFRCQLAGSAVTAISEVDEAGHEVTRR
jgi:hypothetical protein